MRKLVTMLVVGTVLLASAMVSDARTKSKKAIAVTPTAVAQNKVTVKISNFQFTPKNVTVAVGTTVEWVNDAGRHTVVADNGAFKSDVLTAGGRFEHKFDKVGTFAYHCGFHGGAGGKDMAGTVIVKK